MDRGSQIHIGGNVTGQVAIGDFVYQAHAPGGVINQIVVTDPIRALPRPVDVRPRARRGQVERSAVITEVTDAIDHDPVQIIARDGWGKTSIVAQLAHDPGIERYKDGVAVISGWGLPVEDIEQAIFDAFYESTLPDTVHKVTPGQLRTSLGDVEAAIVVDDLDLSRQHVDRLTDACAGGGFVSTASTQTQWSGGAIIDLDGMSNTDALVLFEQRLGRAVESTELTAVAAFITRIRGYPMAIVATASAARRGGTLIELLTRLMSGTDPVAAVHDEIAATLTLAETRLLSVLAAVRGDPLPPDAVGSVAGVDDAGTLLEGLTRDGLLEAASPRYRLPRSSSVLLDLAVDGPATARGLAAWCGTESDPELVAAAGPAIVSAIQSASQGQDYAAAMALGRSADPALSLSGRWGVWGQVLDSTKQAATAANDSFVEGWSLHQLGTLALAEQRHGDAFRQLTEAADIRTRIGDHAGLEVTEHNLSLLSPPPAVVPPDSAPPATPPSGSGVPWWAWTMIVVGLFAVAGLVWFIVAKPSPDPNVEPTIATQNGELVPTTDMIEIFDVDAGRSVSSEFELINIGTGPVDVASITVEGDGSITVASECDTIEPGVSCLVSVAFAPGGPGEFRAVLSVEHSGINSTIQIPVIGVAIDPPEAFVSVDPVNLDFGVISRGGDASRSITITNGGNVEINVHDIRVEPDVFVRDDAAAEGQGCATLAPQASCSVGVRFVADEPGAFEGTVFIDHSGENPNFEIALSGVVPERPNLTIAISDVEEADPVSVIGSSAETPELWAASVMVRIENASDETALGGFEYRFDSMSIGELDSWSLAQTVDGRPAEFVLEQSLGPGEHVLIPVLLGFDKSVYNLDSDSSSGGSVAVVRAEVDSCSVEDRIASPPCRVVESNEEDNTSGDLEVPFIVVRPVIVID
jgi:hypothetical protein